jgi:N-acetylmuramoyl-L-alanine amidase
MSIQKFYLTGNIFSRPGKPITKVKGIVVHWVGNAGSGPMGNRNYFESLKSQPYTTGEDKKKAVFASAHFIIGLGGEMLQCLPENEIGYHVGANSYKPLAVHLLSTYPNNCTLGIELCHPAEYDGKELIRDSAKWQGKFTPQTLEAAGALIKELLERYDLDNAAIFRHFDITGKDCPRYFVNNEDEWVGFLKQF